MDVALHLHHASIDLKHINLFNLGAWIYPALVSLDARHI